MMCDGSLMAYSFVAMRTEGRTAERKDLALGSVDGIASFQ